MYVTVNAENKIPFEDSCQVTTFSHDVGIVQIAIPSGTIDSTGPIVPQTRVRNYGSNNETFNVTFRIGSGYTQTRSKTLNVGIEDTVNFPTWAPIRGTYTTRCSTYLAGDVNHNNDTLSGTVTVRVLDVGVLTILAPSGTIDSEAVVTPRVKVKNYGSISSSFPVWFRIHLDDSRFVRDVGQPFRVAFSKVKTLPYNWTKNENDFVKPSEMLDGKLDQVYEDSIWLTLGAGDSASIDFATWTPTIPDTYRLESFTELSGDINAQNDTSYGSVIVVRPLHDVGIVQVLAPVSIVDSGTIVIPTVTVRNYGTVSENFPVIFSIGNFYNDTVVKNLGALQADTVSFTQWTAIQVGTHIFKCTTLLAGDINHTNDIVIDSVTVQPEVKINESSSTQLIPNAFALGNNIPNPFASQTLIRYSILKDCAVNLNIYNCSGTLVRTLKSGIEKAGFYSFIWNGDDEKEKKVAKGVYFYHIKAGEFTATKKMMKLE
jgi:hypothetical protein